MPGRLTIEEYKKRLYDKYGDRIEVVGKYVNSDTPMKHIIVSDNNRILIRSPRNLLYDRADLWETAGDFQKSVRTSEEKFKRQLKNKWKGKVELIGKFSGMGKITEFKCDKSHIFSKMPANMLECGCKICRREGTRINLDEKRKIFYRSHVRLIDTEYKGSGASYKFKCKKGHTFYSRIDSIKAAVEYGNKGCPLCSKAIRYSKVSIEWLTDISNRLDINIIHAENGKEHKVKMLFSSKYFRVDGYCQDYNIIFEFYGDIMHGNKKAIHGNKKCHPYRKKATASTLYKETMEREKKLSLMGYKIISIWESEYYNTYEDWLKINLPIIRRMCK